MHKVICKICGRQFDRDVIPAVLVSPRRYAHKRCADKEGIKGIMNQETEISAKDPDLKALENYILKLFDLKQITPLIRKQINDLSQQGYTYSGILKTLIYWFEIQKQPLEKSHGGIGIVKYVYDQSYQYYYKIYNTKKRNDNKDIQQYRPKEKEVTIPPPQTHPRPPKLFFQEDEVSQ